MEADGDAIRHFADDCNVVDHGADQRDHRFCDRHFGGLLYDGLGGQARAAAVKTVYLSLIHI